MENVFHHAEPFAESGSTYGNSAQKALGRPNLDRWEMFTRETLQNSWDARDRSSHDDGVTFSIEYRELSDIPVKFLRKFFGNDFRGLQALSAFLKKSNLEVLVVSDTGTSGLQGPTSAATHVQMRDDFVSFIRNIGRNSDKKLGGGTYGFGKGVFFDASRCNTVLVYTRTTDESGMPSNRFIAMSNGESFNHAGLNFTGRHWWGAEAKAKRGGAYAEPFIGKTADMMAEILGMDKYFSVQQPKGTTIMVLGPTFEADTTPEQAMQSIANSLTKWAWPHMVAKHPDMDPIHFNVVCKEKVIVIPDPEEDQGLAHIVRAYKHAFAVAEPESTNSAKSEWHGEGKRKSIDIQSLRPAEFLGRLTIEALMFNAPESHIVGTGLNNHIALMRNPRMIVTYWEGPKESSSFAYGGVFIASSKLDPLFAASEPPAHDEWNPKSVDLNDSRFFQAGKNTPRRTNPVKVAVDRIKSKLKENFSTKAPKVSAKSSTVVNELSDKLGDYFSSSTGNSSKVTLSPTPAQKTVISPTKPRKGVKVSDGFIRLIGTSAGVVAVYQLKAALSDNAYRHGVTITVNPCSIIEGHRYFEATDGIQLPKGLCWFTEDPSMLDWELLTSNQSGTNLEVHLKDVRRWQSYAAFLQPPNTAMSIQVNTKLEFIESSEEAS